ncbi:siderophore-interacting protein [Vibrio vulnificus]
MNRPEPQVLTVVSTQTLTPNMQRIVFEGDFIKQFPQECEGGYIKLLFDARGNTDLSQLAEGERPVMRTYTIRRFDAKRGAIEVDFVRHITSDTHCGFAARWAMAAQVGDAISMVGPGTIAPINTDADWFFMVADMTSLPALSAKAARLPKEAKGYAVVKITEASDQQTLELPSNIELIWLTGEETLAQKVTHLPWLAGRASVWCACEFDSMRQLRQYFRNEREVGRDHIYISSYWKNGVSEDGHKVLKREDAENHAD